MSNEARRNRPLPWNVIRRLISAGITDAQLESVFGDGDSEPVEHPCQTDLTLERRLFSTEGGLVEKHPASTTTDDGLTERQRISRTKYVLEEAGYWIWPERGKTPLAQRYYYWPKHDDGAPRTKIDDATDYRHWEKWAAKNPAKKGAS